MCIGGCIGQRDGAKLMEKLPHVDVVFGTQNIDRLPRLIESVLVGKGHQAEVYEASEKIRHRPAEQARAYVGRMVAYYLGLQ